MSLVIFVSSPLVTRPVHAFADGDGSAGNPYQIASCAHFTEIETALAADYIVTADLDCTASGNSIMVGVSSAFTGTLNGGGHTITVAISTTTDPTGLIVNASGAAIRNLRVAGTVTSTAGHIGGIAGDVGGLSVMENVSNTASVSGNGYVGGIVGDINGSIIRNSYNVGSVTSVSGGYFAGGVAGLIGAGTTLEYVYNRGVVSGSYHVGGILGQRNDNASLVRYTFNVGQVVASQSTFFFGGIWGNDVWSTDSALAAGYTENYFDSSRSARLMCGYSNYGTMINPTAGACSRVNVNWADANYFKNNAINPPLNEWDFDTEWETVENGYPALQAIASDSVAVNDSPTVPTVPRNFATGAISSNSITVTWTVPESTGGVPLTNYLLNYKTQAAEEWTPLTISSSASSYTVTGLTPSTAYDFSLYASNSLGDSPTATVSASTVEGLGTPANLTVVQSANNDLAVNVSWDAAGGSPVAYYLQYRRISKTWDEEAYSEYADNTTSISNLLGYLTPSTTYVFRVYALDAEWNQGGFSEEVEYAVPDAPSVVIGTCQELQDIGADIENIPEMKFVTITLSGDIDCSATATWNDGSGFEPIDGFSGILDGQGHTIFNLTIDRASMSSVGLFENLYNTGTIKNIAFSGADISGEYNVGIAVGDTSDDTTGIIQNVTVTDSLVSGIGRIGGLIGRIDEDSNFILDQLSVSASVVGQYHVGGVFGVADEASGLTLTEVSFDGEVSATSEGERGVGGIAGHIEAGNVEAHDVTVSGSIEGYEYVGGAFGGIVSEDVELTDIIVTASVAGTTGVGGIIGHFEAEGDIAYSKLMGTVTGTGMRVGGIAGYADDIFVYRVENEGAISGQYRVGGLIGSGGTIDIESSSNTGTVTASYLGETSFADFKGVGGLVGICWNTSIARSKNSGAVNGTGALYVGGLVGASGALYISESLNAGEVDGNVTYQDYNGVGGLVGAVIETNIQNSMNHGAVIGKVNVGGIAGFAGNAQVSNSYNRGDLTSSVAMSEGGIIGASLPIAYVGDLPGVIQLTNTFNVGEVTVSSETYRSGGGVLGGVLTGTTLTLSNNWWANSLDFGIGNVSLKQYGEETTPEETPVASEVTGQYQKVELKSVFKGVAEISPLTDWDFSDVWNTKENDYPELVALIPTITPTVTPTATQTATPSATSTPTATPTPKAVLAEATPTPTVTEEKEETIFLNDFLEYLNGSGKTVTSLVKNQVIYFTYKNQEHTATIKDIFDDYVVVIIASTPQEVRLTVGETKKVDVSDDGVADIQVTLQRISGGKADISFMQLAQTTPGTTATPPVTKPTEASENVGTSLLLKVGGGSAVTLFILLLFVLVKRKRNEH